MTQRDRIILDRELADAETLTIIVCQGPPRCFRQGEAAIVAQKAGCRWCDRIVRTAHGETRTGPGLA